MTSSTIISLLGTALVFAAKYGVIVTAVGWLTVKGVKAADAYKAKAEEEKKRVKFARVLDSLAHFVTVGVQREAQAVQVAVAAGKPAPAVGSVAFDTVKQFLGDKGLDELKDVFGILTNDVLETHLEVVTKAAVQKASSPSAPSTGAGSTPSPQ